MVDPATPIISEIGTIALAIIVAYAGVKRLGKSKTFIFLLGSILWTAPIENLGVLQGSYTYYGYRGLFFPAYPGFLFWTGVAPLWIQLGWFIVALPLYMLTHDVMLSKRRAGVQAIVSGLMAVNIDLLIDPVAVSNKLWLWMGPSLYVIGVPIYNWIGWFLLISFYDFIFNQTIANNRPIKGLSVLEKVLFKDSESSGKVKVAKFILRLIILNLAIIVLLTIIAGVMREFPNFTPTIGEA